MIRIAYVINYIVKNGPSSVVFNLINNLDKEMYDISLITLFLGNDPEVVTYLQESGVTIYECEILSRMKCLLWQNKEFLDIVKKGQFDVLHTHGLIPDILSSNLKCSMKRVTTIHNNMYEDYLDTYGYVKSHILVPFHLDALRKLDECVCCSASVYQAMRRKLKNITYIRNGIEPARARSVVTRKGLDIPEEARVFMYAGALTSRKNIVWLIKNFVQYHKNDEYLLVLGTGEKENECRKEADDYVRMLGFQTDTIAYMNISDVYISASKSEGFSVSVLEALSCGLGVFLSDIPSHREVVGMGRHVYLGEIFTQGNFKIALEKLRKKQFDRKAIVDFQTTELSAEYMAERYKKIYSGQLLCEREY